MAIVASSHAQSAPDSQALGDDEVLVGVAFVPDGEELRLVRHGTDFTILLEHTELMSTLASASEEALATMTCERLGARPAPQLLIGGYGMGYTLRAALSALPADGGVVVSELVPEIIEWALGPMRGLTADCLDDPRVTLVEEDVALLIGAAREGYDAILLDVDNGPEGLTRLVNDHLYTAPGLAAARAALKPGGILAVWSAYRDGGFAQRLEEGGFEVSEVPVRGCPKRDDLAHVIWFARKPG